MRQPASSSSVVDNRQEKQIFSSYGGQLTDFPFVTRRRFGRDRTPQQTRVQSKLDSQTTQECDEYLEIFSN